MQNHVKTNAKVDVENDSKLNVTLHKKWDVKVDATHGST